MSDEAQITCLSSGGGLHWRKYRENFNTTAKPEQTLDTCLCDGCSDFVIERLIDDTQQLD